MTNQSATNLNWILSTTPEQRRAQMESGITVKSDQSREIRVLASALNANGRIGILEVVRTPNGDGTVTKRQTWTGIAFPNTRQGQKQANAHILAFNCK